MKTVENAGPVPYRGYAIYDRLGVAIWEKNSLSGHEYVARHKDCSGFTVERVHPALPPVRSFGKPARTIDAAKRDIDFLLKFGTYDVPGEIRV